MTKVISGLIGATMAIIFLGYYAISLNSAPLWVIIVAILAMVCTDVFQSLKNGNQKTGQ
jgi:F0F1-type ATP synthase assembly protein I